MAEQPKHGDITYYEGKTRIGTLAPTEPLLTSRIEVDMDTGLARCTVRLRNGYTATLIMSQSERYRHTPPELKARIALVRAALIAWGVGDERWHDRDVGRAADLLLALHLPQAAEPFRQALLVPDADRIAGYLTAGP